MMIANGSPTTVLNEPEIREFVARALGGAALKGKRVLAVIPDHTRSGPTGTMFRAIADTLQGHARQIDFLIALGTHPEMTDERINHYLGLTAEERATRYPQVRIFNHLFDEPTALREVGRLSRPQVEELTNGMLSLEVPVRINKLVFDYDHVVICGPVFPHEVVGFSGGHKYFFPGIAARQIIDFTHWVGALLTNPVVNGCCENRVRATIEAAADLVSVERSLIAYVVEGYQVRGLFAGDVRETWKAAAALSDQVNIVYHDKPYKLVLSCSPAMYDDIWTAGKCMYKLEPVVADGGTLIIYAPHIDEVSYTHGKVLDEIGYHTRDFFVKQWTKYERHPWGIVAHSTHVKGVGRYDEGIETARVNVVLATRISEERCRRINLGYMDPATINPQDYANREAEGVLLVPKAGEVLFRLKDMGKFT